MSTKYLKDCPLIFISDDLINAGLYSGCKSPLTFEFPYRVIQQVIRSERRKYFNLVLDGTHGALAKLFAAVDAGKVTDPEQLAVVNWLRADDGDLIKSYRIDDKCKQREVYRTAIKLARLALACQVNSDAGSYYDDAEYTQYYIERLDKDDSVDSILDTVCSLAKHACTWDVRVNVPAVRGQACMNFILASMPDRLNLDEKYVLAINELSFTDIHEIESELRVYYEG